MSAGWYMALGFISPLLLNAALAWGFTAITNGNSSTFWTAFFVLIGIRLFFALADSIFSALLFKLYRKKFVVQQLVNDFRRFEFPKRENLNEDWLMYLKRLQETESLPFTVRRAAAFLEGQFDLADKSSFVMGRQSEAAMEAAVNAWSTTPQLAVRSQREADEREYWEFRRASDALRKKYDPNDEWNEATTTPPEYQSEHRALLLAHEGMLRRRNGWTDVDSHD
jgi:hypothetical protein